MFDMRLTSTCLVADLLRMMQSVGTQRPLHWRIVLASQALFTTASRTKLYCAL